MKGCFGTKEFNKNSHMCNSCSKVFECAKANNVVYNKYLLKLRRKKINKMQKITMKDNKKLLSSLRTN